MSFIVYHMRQIPFINETFFIIHQTQLLKY